MRSELFWDITQRIVIISWPLNMGPIWLSRSVGKESSLYAAHYCRRAQISSTIRRKPEITSEKWDVPKGTAVSVCQQHQNWLEDSQLVKHSHFWEVDSSLAAQVPRFSMNPKVHYHVHNKMNQIIPVHTLHSIFFKIYINIILLSTPSFSNWFLSLRFPHQNPVWFFILPRTCHMLYSSHQPLFFLLCDKPILTPM
jgi:hypothetical protein